MGGGDKEFRAATLFLYLERRHCGRSSEQCRHQPPAGVDAHNRIRTSIHESRFAHGFLPKEPRCVREENWASISSPFRFSRRADRDTLAILFQEPNRQRSEQPSHQRSTLNASNAKYEKAVCLSFFF